MFKQVKIFLQYLDRDQQGSYFIEMALVVIGVALTVFAAAQSLASEGIAQTYSNIEGKLKDATVPDIP